MRYWLARTFLLRIGSGKRLLLLLASTCPHPGSWSWQLSKVCVRQERGADGDDRREAPWIIVRESSRKSREGKDGGWQVGPVGSTGY